MSWLVTPCTGCQSCFYNSSFFQWSCFLNRFKYLSQSFPTLCHTPEILVTCNKETQMLSKCHLIVTLQLPELDSLPRRWLGFFQSLVVVELHPSNTTTTTTKRKGPDCENDISQSQPWLQSRAVKSPTLEVPCGGTCAGQHINYTPVELEKKELQTSETWTVEPWEHVEGGEFIEILILQNSTASYLPATNAFVSMLPVWVELLTALVRSFFMFLDLSAFIFSDQHRLFLDTVGARFPSLDFINEKHFELATTTVATFEIHNGRLQFNPNHLFPYL